VEYPLTPSQRTFYPKGIPGEEFLWNLGGIIVFYIKYSAAQLNRSFHRALEAQEEIRLRFVEQNGQPVAYVSEHQEQQYPFRVFSTMEELMAATREFVCQPISIFDPLLRCVLFQVGEDRSGFMISCHHMIADGFSCHVMADTVYHYLNDLPLEQVQPQSYGEHFAAEQAFRESPRYLKAKEYWMEQIASAFPEPLFPLQSVDYRAAELEMDFPDPLFRKIQQFCTERKITPTTFFTTVLATYVQREFQRSEFSIGVPILNRHTPQELHSYGLYMHILPMTVRLAGEDFLSCGRKIDGARMRLLRYRKFTQTEIHELLEQQGQARSGLFDIVFDFQVFPRNEQFEFHIQYGDHLSVPLELHFNVMGNGQQKLRMRYRTALFSEAQIRDLYNRIVGFLLMASLFARKDIIEVHRAFLRIL